MRHKTFHRRRPAPVKFLTGLAALAVLAVSAVPASADPAVSVTGYRIIGDLPAFPAVPANGPSTLQAAAQPRRRSISTFAYSNATEDLKTALTNFAPGLLGNPVSVPRCPEANLQADTCPENTRIGSSGSRRCSPARPLRGPGYSGACPARSTTPSRWAMSPVAWVS